MTAGAHGVAGFCSDSQRVDLASGEVQKVATDGTAVASSCASTPVLPPVPNGHSSGMVACTALTYARHSKWVPECGG